jgi:tRNA (guanine10-N2)-methyltransferase
VRLPDAVAARALVRRSILAQSIGELWGSSEDFHGKSLSVVQAPHNSSHPIADGDPASEPRLDSVTGSAGGSDGSRKSILAALHESVRRRSVHLWSRYSAATSFRIDIDSFQGSRASSERVALFEGLSFIGFQGPIRMKNPDEVFTILEHWEYVAPPQGKKAETMVVDHASTQTEPQRMYFTRHVGTSSRHLVRTFSLKTRRYVSTTSMDAELALVTANLALADEGKLFYDPFTGTGGFPLACAAFGATCFGSDIDGRAVRGTGEWGGGTERKKGPRRSIKGNFEQYGLGDRLGGLWVADLTNTPLTVGNMVLEADADRRDALARKRRPLFDGIVCDPPYGVREGLKVLGSRDKKEHKSTPDLWA